MANNNNSESRLGIETETMQIHQHSIEMTDSKVQQNISHVERVWSPDDDLKKEDMDFSRVDKE